MNWDDLGSGTERFESALRFLKSRADEAHGVQLSGELYKSGGADPTPMQIGSIEQRSEEEEKSETRDEAAATELVAMLQEAGYPGSEELFAVARRFVGGKKKGGKGGGGARGLFGKKQRLVGQRRRKGWPGWKSTRRERKRR